MGLPAFLDGIDGTTDILALTDDYTFQIGEGGPIIGGWRTRNRAAIYITAVDGLGIPTVRTGDNPRPSDYGAYFGRDFIGQRMVTLTVNVTGDNADETLSNWEALMAFWQLDTPDGSASMPLKFQLPGRPVRRVNGRPRDAAPDYSIINAGQMSAVLLFGTADPSIFDDIENSDAVGLADVGTGRLYPRAFPTAYGAGSAGGIITAVNDGNFPTRPVITITGPCTNPTVENVNTSERMQFVISLQSTDSLVIDIDADTVELNGGSRYDCVTLDSDWFSLGPGSTEVHFNANAFTLGATCSLEWRSAWMM